MKFRYIFSFLVLVSVSQTVIFAKTINFHADKSIRHTIVKTPSEGGIKEIIPNKLQERYKKWKNELLSTEFGRQQWEVYANNKNFILTIKISDEKGKGAGTNDYLWNESGDFVGATITLGNKIDRGYPDAVYYPVMNSLSLNTIQYSVDGNILAATKMAHEIGHVNQTFKVNKEHFQLQDKLMPEYIRIFLHNGYDTKDPKLVNLAQQMGGTPVKIWASREYWSEVNAMKFLSQKINKEIFYCNILTKIKKNVEQYASDYEERFDQVAELESFNTSCRK